MTVQKRVCVCVCVHRISLFPPSCAALDVSLSTPCFFFFPFSFCSLTFRSHSSFLSRLLSAPGALAEAQLLGGQQLFFGVFFCRKTEILCVGKKKRWDYLSQTPSPIIFMRWLVSLLALHLPVPLYCLLLSVQINKST